MKTSLNKIFADFNNVDSDGRVRLTTKGTLDDIRDRKIELRRGLEVILDDDDGLTTVGVVEFSDSENIWVAKIDWNAINHER